MNCLYPVALSLVSHANFRDYWENIKSFDPEELYNRIINKAQSKMQQNSMGMHPPDPLDAAHAIIEKCKSSGIKILNVWDNVYPVLLSSIHRPPLVLYQKGNAVFNKCIAIVGTRKADPLSLKITDRIVNDLVPHGFSVVSGMAIGIDRQAHFSALVAGIPTIGVLAQGIDRIYPYQNMDLFDQITTSPNSCVISEYPPGSRADKWTFARRNRIISGLSHGVVVIKAGERSGAMITARHAIEQNREVFACPGHSYDPEYGGCHFLIRNGAVLLSDGNDIITEFHPAGGIVNRNKNDKILDNQGDLFILEQDAELSAVKKKLLSIIPLSGMGIDDLSRLCGQPVEVIQGMLVELELSGLIDRNGLKYYRNS